MSNHAHLLIKVKTVPLSKIMQGIQLRFTQYFNWLYHHTGHVFEQRYKSFLCENEGYLITLLCYIHQNPLRAHFSDGFAYPWSSHHDYHVGFSNFTDISFILDMLHSNRDTAIRHYLDMIGAPIEKPAKLFQQKREESLERIKTEEGKLLRMSRSIQAEGAFGEIKADMEFRRFLCRGAKNILAEMTLWGLAHNVNKLHNKVQSGRCGFSYLHSLKTA